MPEYKFGAFYFFPPPDLRRTINELRSRLDPKSQSYCDAHISLSIPLPAPLTKSDLRNLETVAYSIEPIDIKYGPVTSYPGHAGVVLKIEPANLLHEVVNKLESQRAFDGATPRRYPFSPHMTIAEFITLEKTQELVRELTGLGLEGQFKCTHVSYAVPDENFHFEERKFIQLGK